jgi:hypothetical protein
MPLFSMKFRPGINKDQTDYTNEGGWFDSDKVRFNNGLPEVIGGWEKKTTNSFLGSCRSLHAWVATDSELYLTVGTNIKYYVDEGGGFYDITPIRTTTSAGAITFAAVNGSSTITVTNVSHGALENDFVTFSGAVSLGGQITAAILNQEYQVETVIDADNYTITARTVSSIVDITVGGVLVPTTVNADGSDTGNGGASVVGVYQINTGLDTTVAGIGWGAGTWGRGTWGSPATSPAIGQILRLWSEDNWGEDLIFNVRDGPIYYWDKSSGTSTRGVLMSSLGGASGVPTVSRKTIVSNQQRQVVSFGVNEIGSSDQDLMLVRYSDFESAVNWTPTLENNAGRQLLSNGSAIITAFETQKEILIWTDTCVYSMQFVGGDLVYRFEIASLGPSIIGPNAAVSADNAVFWMDREEFYVYTGRVQPIPCTVKEYVFSDINLNQSPKIVAAFNKDHNEITWFYPSADSENIDKYVTYDFGQQVWAIGTLNRTAWLESGLYSQPVAAGTDGYLYYQEFGYSADGSAISAYIESSDIDASDGQQFVFFKRLLPDITFIGTANDPTATYTVKGRNAPGETLSTKATATVGSTTGQKNIRGRARQIALRVESSDLNVSWRLGTNRLDIQQDGQR